jgi:[FeFe] hydrogenase H-cluster maturation GTPase HydF
MDHTPKGNRLQIALFGRMNVGKSSLLNMIAGQDFAITSPVAGTTTDVVEKTMELPPLGPVVFLDTAGLDDASELSSRRLKKTKQIYERADVALLVVEPDIWTDYEENVLREAVARKIPVLTVINKIDLISPSPAFTARLMAKDPPFVAVSSTDAIRRDSYLTAMKRHLIEIAPEGIFQAPSLIGDLLPPGGLAVLVVPIDLQAPRGRLILPQVQTIRDALDNDAAALIVKERELAPMLARLNRRPDIVICDSQAILKVSADVPKEVPLTTFSILFARQKGDLAAAAEGATHIDALKPGDKILIAEACSHHALQDDIGRVKIPRWLRQYVGGEVESVVSAGREYPENLKDYSLVIHCGACMLTRREMLNRIQQAREANVPVTNYGLAISFLQGVIRRTLSPFPLALMAYDRKMTALKSPPDRL